MIALDLKATWNPGDLFLLLPSPMELYTTILDDESINSRYLSRYVPTLPVHIKLHYDLRTTIKIGVVLMYVGRAKARTIMTTLACSSSPQQKSAAVFTCDLQRGREGKDAHSPRPALPFRLPGEIIPDETRNENEHVHQLPHPSGSLLINTVSLRWMFKH
jgi:hypothetical protein